MSSKRLTPDAWQRHITSWQQSGLSQKAYCQQHLLGLSTFYSKYRELKKRNGHTLCQPTHRVACDSSHTFCP